MKKIILGVLIGLVVLVVALVIIVALSIDGIIKNGVETFGPRFTKVTVKLDKVNLSLFSGSGQIDGLVIGSPDGFKAPQSISVGSASLALQPASLLSDKIVIKSIKVEAPEITLETGLGGNNLKKILDNLNETTGGGSTGTNAPAKPAEKQPGKKLEVDDFLITGAKLHLSVTGVGSSTVPLPEIHLTGLGAGSDGLTAAELTKKVLTAIEQSAAKAAAESAGDIAKGATSLIKGAGGSATNAAGKVGNAIGNLFKKN